ncbi:protein TonB [Luteibacter sp. Sphag1AF]|uniref:energy transducer TonB n=1 Tax=Luteibacter sp. Sphag1AF TaxID=2587031 RepID=UPI00160FC9E3|nr:energy transducer TonB [Luteibacter sp. Sphag1AF]MBB3226658.1 protein TonB [Luteibacter sp. Sphag1AF]
MSSHLNVSFLRRAAIAVAVLAVVGAGAVFALHQSHGESGEVVAASDDTADAGTQAKGGGEVEILLGLARDAMKDNRLVSPQGNNAYEYYLSVVQLQPNNVVALDALRETLPFASTEVERLINQRELDEARREIALLRDFDPTNYTLVILGAKLDAQQRVVTAEDEARASMMRAADANPARATRAPEPVAAPVVATAPATTVHNPVRSAPTPAAPAAAAAAPAVTTAATRSETPPILRREVSPSYPADARRLKRQGWVEVSFTVEPDGRVSQASVADADPRNLFDLAAVSAVKRWEFSPATRDGLPVRSVQRRRIQFTL